jgi:hypothetical protein
MHCIFTKISKVFTCYFCFDSSIIVVQKMFNEIDAKLHQLNQKVMTDCLFDCIPQIQLIV